MAIEFDPAWEYWDPNPEIQYIFDVSGDTGKNFDKITDTLDDSSSRSTPTGLRFGKGNPNSGFFRLAYNLKPERERRSYTHHCKKCTLLFFSESPIRRYCSKECRPKREVLHKECIHCHGEFTTTREDKKYCHHHCYIAAVTRKELVAKECQSCGSQYHTRKESRLYCSIKCYLDYRCLDGKNCPSCYRDFYPVHRDQKYCSYSCRPKPAKRLSSKPCQHCQQSFQPKRHYNLFCGRSCARSHQHQTKTLTTT